jgi:hypothetical protein
MVRLTTAGRLVKSCTLVQLAMNHFDGELVGRFPSPLKVRNPTERVVESPILDLALAQPPGRRPYVAPSQVFVDRVHVVVWALAIVRLQLRLVRSPRELDLDPGFGGAALHIFTNGIPRRRRLLRRLSLHADPFVAGKKAADLVLVPVRQEFSARSGIRIRSDSDRLDDRSAPSGGAPGWGPGGQVALCDRCAWSRVLIGLAGQRTSRPGRLGMPPAAFTPPSAPVCWERLIR